MAESTGLQAALPDYDITTELGRGAMGIVYLGTHRALGRTVAIKELPPSFAADAAVRERFLAEARTVASLDHPHVVVIHDFVDRAGHLAIVMEHLPNGTVWDQFLHHGLAAPRACGLTLAALAGLHHAHDRGVMHRDIKPENLIFTHDWQLKVTDFGIAQVLTGDSTMSTEEGTIVGTPAYMSPEQAEGRSCGPPADVYACGAMLYEMLTGVLPFASAPTAMDMVNARLSSDPPPIGHVGPAIPAAIGDVVMQALARSERDRYPSAEAFGVALGKAAADTWGPDWMTESGTAVRGSAAIEQAARTTDRRPSGPGSPSAPSAGAPDPDGGGGGGDDRPPIAESITEGPDGAAATERRDHGAAPVFELPPAAPIVPQQRQRVVGADLNQLAPADIVNLRDVRAPGTPMPFLVLGLALAAIAIAIGLLGRGVDPAPTNAAGIAVDGASVVTDEPVEIDLTETVPLTGITGDLSATFLGIPIGSASVSDGIFDPGYLRFTGAGVVELRGQAGADASVSFPVRTRNSPYPTAPFVIAALVGIGGLASIQANLRGLRARRFRTGPFIGLAISGALAAGALAVVAMLVRSTPADATTVVGCAVAGALSAAVVGEGYRRWYRRRRLRRIAVARSRA